MNVLSLQWERSSEGGEALDRVEDNAGPRTSKYKPTLPQMQLGWMLEEQHPNLRAMKLWKSLPERGKRREKLTGK